MRALRVTAALVILTRVYGWTGFDFDFEGSGYAAAVSEADDNGDTVVTESMVTDSPVTESTVTEVTVKESTVTESTVMESMEGTVTESKATESTATEESNLMSHPNGDPPTPGPTPLDFIDPAEFLAAKDVQVNPKSLKLIA